MSVQDHLKSVFGDYLGPDRQNDWVRLKSRLLPGTCVQGHVVVSEPFGVFIDIEMMFPVLLLITKFAHVPDRRFVYPDNYPAIGSVLGGNVYVFDDDLRQIGITQLPQPPSMPGDG